MNVFGERQNPEKFIPGVLSAVMKETQVTIHSDVTRTIPGSRHYIHVRDVVDGLKFILSLPKEYKHEGEFSGASCPKFNLVGPEEIDNLQLAKMIANVVGKPLNYTMVDFHSSRPGHDLRYILNIVIVWSDLSWSGTPYLVNFSRGSAGSLLQSSVKGSSSSPSGCWTILGGWTWRWRRPVGRW